jgi:hypothetical protein
VRWEIKTCSVLKQRGCAARQLFGNRRVDSRERDKEQMCTFRTETELRSTQKVVVRAEFTMKNTTRSPCACAQVITRGPARAETWCPVEDAEVSLSLHWRFQHRCGVDTVNLIPLAFKNDQSPLAKPDRRSQFGRSTFAEHPHLIQETTVYDGDFGRNGGSSLAEPVWRIHPLTELIILAL